MKLTRKKETLSKEHGVIVQIKKINLGMEKETGVEIKKVERY